MSEISIGQLNQICERVLEQMAFAFPDPVSEDALSWDHHVHIRYEGLDEEGDVHLSASEGFLREVGAGMLGIEPEDIEPDECAATLREIANVVCGEIVHELGGESRRIRLGLPEDGEDPFAGTKPEPETLVHVVAVEGEPLRTAVRHKLL